MEQKKNEKLSDKAFARLILTSILGILFCFVCLCSTTYAWFTDSVSSGENEIKTASEFLLSVSVSKDGETEQEVTLENPLTLENAQGEYTVTLTLPQGSASGYLVISAGVQEYYTDYLQRNDTAEHTLSFTLNVNTAQNVTFTVRWGIYSNEESSVKDEVLYIE